MRSEYISMMAVKLGTLVFGHGVRPAAWDPCTGGRGDRLASTRRKRAP